MLMEDMDTSDSGSEYSHEDDDADDDWVQSDVDMGDEESARRPRKRPNKKQSSKLNTSGEAEEVKVESEVCCTCSKYSLCKTSKCQCRAAKGFCGPSCGCIQRKCSNRQDATAESAETSSGCDEIEKNHELASHGAMLLQNALVEKDSETNNNGGTKRKPLSDIGNAVGKSNAEKPGRRKKWSTIQLVPVAPATAEAEKATVEAPQQPDRSVGEAQAEAVPVKLPRAMQSAKSSTSTKADNNGPSCEDVPPLKLPRAMLSAASNSSGFLRERNADHKSNEVIKESSSVHPSRSPARVRPPRVSEEKENYGR